MIDGETKQKLLQELEKSGNVYLSCMKVGINKSTFYRWREDKGFWKTANTAIKRGRENNCDVAEHALMMNVKDKKMDAIKYVLAHNSARYKPKIRKVIIEHSQTGEKKEELKQMQREHWSEIGEAYKSVIELVRNPVMKFTEEKTKDILGKMPGIQAKIGTPEYIDEDSDVLFPGEFLPDPDEDDNDLDNETMNKIILDLPEDNE